MRIGMNAALGLGGPQTITEVVEEIAEASRAGYPAAWMPHMPPWA